MMTEVKTNMAFSNLRRGQRLQVDIHDPYVQALVAGGYLTVIWKEPDGSLDDSADPPWIDAVPGVGVDSGASQETAAQVDGPRGSGHVEGDPDSA